MTSACRACGWRHAQDAACIPPIEKSERSPAEHGRRPRPGCQAERCWCAYLRFHAERSNSKLRKGGAGD
jgi:hypothetical protein